MLFPVSSKGLPSAAQRRYRASPSRVAGRHPPPVPCRRRPPAPPSGASCGARSRIMRGPGKGVHGSRNRTHTHALKAVQNCSQKSALQRALKALKRTVNVKKRSQKAPQKARRALQKALKSSPKARGRGAEGARGCVEVRRRRRQRLCGVNALLNALLNAPTSSSPNARRMLQTAPKTSCVGVRGGYCPYFLPLRLFF